MVQVKCPQCATAVNGAPGESVKCPNCGFAAAIPGTPPVGPSPARAPPVAARPGPPFAAPPAAPSAASRIVKAQAALPASGPEVPALKSLSVWAYLLSILGIGTFFLARWAFPFVLALAGAGLGVTAYVRNQQDRRALVAAILGAVGLALAGLFLAIG